MFLVETTRVVAIAVQQGNVTLGLVVIRIYGSPVLQEAKGRDSTNK